MDINFILNNFETLFDSEERIDKFNKLVLDLAVRGMLNTQDPKDEPASVLLKKIEAEKEKLIKEEKIKKEKPLPAITEDEIPYELPKGWEWVRLIDISVNIHYGYNGSANFNIDQPKLLRITDIQNNQVNWDTVPGCDIDKNYITTYQLQNNDILIARTGGTIGKSYLVENLNYEAIFASYLIRLIPCKNNYPDFIKKFIESSLYWKQLFEKSSGTGQPNVNGTSLKSLILPLPPLEEQKRIVSIIETLQQKSVTLKVSLKAKKEKVVEFNQSTLSRLTESKDNNEFEDNLRFVLDNFEYLYSDSRNIKELRQAILQLAVQGKLVEQDPKDEPASELLKKIAKEKEKLIKEGKIKKEKPLPEIRGDEIPFNIPNNWEWVRLSEITMRIGSGSTPRGGKETYISDGIKFIRSQNVWNNGLKLDNIAYISKEIHNKMSYTCVMPKDILLNITGASIARSCLVPDNFDEGNVNQHVSIIRLINVDIRNYLHLSIISPYFFNSIMSIQVGISREGLSKKNLELFLVPIPPLNEQKRIVAKVDQLLKLCDKLEERLNNANKLSAELMESALNGEGRKEA